MVETIIETLKKADNEATRCPYWLILDPTQNMRCDIHVMAFGITGPFFSREDAEGFLKATRYNFSDKARVYCLSGHNSYKYEQLFKFMLKSENQGLREQLEGKWISVKDRLPEYSCKALTVISGMVCISFFDKEGGSNFWNNGGIQEVTNWQPLPETPKEQMERNNRINEALKREG